MVINQIIKHFTDQKLQILNGIYESRNNSVKLQYKTTTAVDKILTTFFKKLSILISKPIYNIQANTIRIIIFYYKSEDTINNKRPLGKNTKQNAKNLTGNTLPIASTRLTFLAILLSKMLQQNVQLELVRLKYVYHDSNIFAQFLGLNSHTITYNTLKKILGKKVSIINTTDKEDDKSVSPITYLTGFKIKISGRLNKQRVVPKKTVKSTYKGAIAAKTNNVVDQSTFTSKNKKGAYSIRVWISHGITS